MTQSNAAATLARMTRTEVQHFSDGGTVRRTTKRTYGAADALTGGLQHGGQVSGPGTGTSDSVPAMLSHGEVVMPADTVRKVGAANLLATIDATHEPTGKPQTKDGVPARADGGPLDPGAVTRVGDAYSGGNVSGDISINGQAPGGTVSSIAPVSMPGAAEAMNGAPRAPLPATASTPSLPAVAPAAAPALAAPAAAAAPAAVDYANRNDAFNAGAVARSAAATMARPVAFRPQSPQASAPASPAAAPTSAPTTALASRRMAAQPQTVFAFADGGLVEDPRQRAAAALIATPQPAMATSTDAAGAAIPVMAVPTAPAAPAPLAPAAEQADVRRMDAAPAPADPPAIAAVPPPGAPAAAPARMGSLTAASAEPVPAVQAGGTVTDLGGFSAPASERLAQINRDTAFLKDKQTWRSPGDPTPGAVLIDNASSEADRRAQFNESANLGNALARTSWSPRRGTQGDDAAVAAALVPISARAQMAQTTAKESGDTARAALAERGTDARARMTDSRQQQAIGIDQQRLGLEGQKISLDTKREDRAAAAAAPTLALAQRKASLQSIVADPASTPDQRATATQQLAGMEGREVTGNQPPAGYRRLPDGNLEFIKGGPADPAVRGSRAPLNDTQAKALQFGTRMQVSGELLDKLAADGFDQPGIIKRTADAVGMGSAANWTQSPQQQQVEQAQRDFVNAVLRRESGAAISASEFDNARKQYFPQVGDSGEAIAQKRQNRDLATRGILAEVPDAESRVAQVRSATPITKVTSAAEVEALPSGATFTTPDGKTRRKP